MWYDIKALSERDILSERDKQTESWKAWGTHRKKNLKKVEKSTWQTQKDVI